ncbi:MAG TPA: Hpt domain-containing protein, partial [Gemmatimonadales bacterium]|nr:Hpt domain-containing protein [Gemmatimonadales bacterium]
MGADSASQPPELPPGLLEDYLENTRAQLGVLSDLADRLVAAGNDREALEALRRETHKIHGSAGSYGYWDASRLAAGMEETVKDWAARPDDRDVDRGSLARWFVVRLAETMQLDVPETRRADRPSGPVLRAEVLSAPEVVVVEDDAALAELLEYGLRSRGYRFAAFRNG